MTIKKSIMKFVVTMGGRGGRDKAPVVGVDQADGADMSALTTMLGREVVDVQDVYAQAGQLKTREEYLQDALEHIAKTCHQSRSQTRRLRWIIRRVELVLAGRPYVAAEHSVPVNGISEYGKVKRLSDRYRHERNDYLAIINSVKSVFENDADVVGYIDALLTSNTVATPDAQTQLEQCAAMARMVQGRVWADTFCTAPVSSRVESAFTQLHNELGAANDRIDELEAQLAESKRTRQRACQLAIGKSQLAKESAAKVSLLKRQLSFLERVTGYQVLDCPPLLKGVLAEAKAASGGVAGEFKLPDLRGFFLRDLLGAAHFICIECGGDKRIGAVGNVCKCHIK